MKIGIFGTGMVGQALAGKLAELGHDVIIGTRNVAETQAKSAPDSMGNPPYSAWAKQHTTVKLATYADAAQHGELLVNATSGQGSIPALEAAGAANIAGKILLDLANPLDFSNGMPPSLFVCNTDSLGEQLQRAFPRVKVVKTLNTMSASVMVNPALVANGDHHVFVCGDDAEAKVLVTAFLRGQFGWKNIIDLGGISTARATEMLVPLWVQLFMARQTPLFTFKIAQ
ncbi:NAD(P)-binding domain-containing protein [candidate division KSB1 bacterium]|nr:NAD(P)-binding domain-containing protein [candidate division KSB1 bacterium]